ncbi:MAG: asparaginase [Deltaproteobacteria bacterium]|nr:asparaginase [Deltaproteobacteria bacterium]
MNQSHLLARHRGGHHHDHSAEHGRGGEPVEYAPPLVELKRGGLTESVHRGAIVVAGPDGRRVQGLGHPAMPTFLRSTAKPLQVAPVITSGAARAFDLSPAELAVMCGSLNGEDFQVELVLGLLAKAGLGPEALQCGVHPPSHRPTAQALQARGESPRPEHNNCAGKHAGMLLLCAHLGYDVHDYTRPEHPVQRLILDTVARLCNYPAEQIGLGVDGCGVPVFRLPLVSLAGAYARLAAPAKADLPAELSEALAQISAACLAHPELIAGTGRLCTRLMQAKPGVFIAKTGAEGSYALALPSLGLGAAFQIEDGGMRALPPAACRLLHCLGLLTHEELEGGLADLARPGVKNHRGEEVAWLEPVFDW